MSKIEWQDVILGKHTGTDGLGVVVAAKQSETGIDDNYVLHIDILAYLGDTPIADPRPAIEAAIKTLKEELGI